MRPIELTVDNTGSAALRVLVALQVVALGERDPDLVIERRRDMLQALKIAALNLGPVLRDIPNRVIDPLIIAIHAPSWWNHLILSTVKCQKVRALQLLGRALVPNERLRTLNDIPFEGTVHFLREVVGEDATIGRSRNEHFIIIDT